MFFVRGAPTPKLSAQGSQHPSPVSRLNAIWGLLIDPVLWGLFLSLGIPSNPPGTPLSAHRDVAKEPKRRDHRGLDGRPAGSRAVCQDLARTHLPHNSEALTSSQKRDETLQRFHPASQEQHFTL